MCNWFLWVFFGGEGTHSPSKYFFKNLFEPSRVASASLNRKNPQSLANTSFSYSIILVSFLFLNWLPLLHKPILVQRKRKKRRRVTMFVVFMFFSACIHFHVCLHSPWFYVIASGKIHDHLQYKLTQGSHVFSSQKNKSCMRRICADVRGNFHPNFHYTIQHIHENLTGNMHQVGFGRKREDFSMKEIHVEPPFPCDYVRNGYCKRIITSTAESKRIFFFF